MTKNEEIRQRIREIPAAGWLHTMKTFDDREIIVVLKHKVPVGEWYTPPWDGLYPASQVTFVTALISLPEAVMCTYDNPWIES